MDLQLPHTEMREQPENASSEIYLHYHFLHSHSHSMLYRLRNTHLAHNIHLSPRRLALVRNDSGLRGFWILFWTPLLLPCPWKPHVSVIKIPRAGLRVPRLSPSHQDRVYGRNAQHELCFRPLYLDVPWLLWPCLLLKAMSDLLPALEW